MGSFGRTGNDCGSINPSPFPVSAQPAFFPMMLNLGGKKCVVVGGGRIAAEKIGGLLRCGARILVISPRAERQIQRQARAGTLGWRRRAFLSRDVEGAFLVIAATNSSTVNEAVFRACRARGVLCNAVDDPEHCDFLYPAVVRRGPLQIAVSTSGRSPGLASRLRRELEQEFGPEWSEWVEHLGEVRHKILLENMSPEERRTRLSQIITPRAFRAFLRMRKAKHARKRTRHKNERG